MNIIIRCREMRSENKVMAYSSLLCLLQLVMLIRCLSYCSTLGYSLPITCYSWPLCTLANLVGTFNGDTRSV